MSREQRLSLGVGLVGLGLMLLTWHDLVPEVIAYGLLGTGIAQFLRSPKNNVLPFVRRNSTGNNSRRKQ